MEIQKKVLFNKKKYYYAEIIHQAIDNYIKYYLDQEKRKATKNFIRYYSYPYHLFAAYRLKKHSNKLASLVLCEAKEDDFIYALLRLGNDFLIKSKVRFELKSKLFDLIVNENPFWGFAMLEKFNMPTSATHSLSLFYAHQSLGNFEAALELGRSLIIDTKLKNNERRRLASQPAMCLQMRDWVTVSKTRERSGIKGRIAYVAASSLPYSISGYTTRTKGVTTGYRKIGYDIHVITKPGFPIDISADLSSNNIPMLDEIEGILHHRIYYPTKKGNAPVEYTRLAAQSLQKKFIELNPEIVIAGSDYSNALPALIAARQLGIPFVYEVRGMWELSRASREQDYVGSPDFSVRQIMESFVAMQSDKVLTLTVPMMRNLVSRGVKSTNIALMPNGVDEGTVGLLPRDNQLAAQLGLPENLPVIGYVGSILEYEGLTDLAKACAGLAGNGISFLFLLVGEEKNDRNGMRPITEEIKTIFENAGIADRLFLTGRVPFSQIKSYYSLIDIAPIPRRPYEVSEMVSPIKPVEALAMGKTLVVSDVEALLDFVNDGTTGLSFRKGDWQDLQSKLATAIIDKGLRDRLSQNGLNFVNNHRTWPKICEAAATHVGLSKADSLV
jgi:glycosyltransferase involved in cell wall biosynthesis